MKNKVGTAVILSMIGTMGLVISAKADWVITPSIEVAEIYTDDVDLDAAFAQSDFVTQTTIGGTAVATGARFNANINYDLNHFYYPSLEGDKDEFRHSLLAGMDSEIVRDFFFIEADAGVTQQFIDRRDTFSTLDIGVSDNRGTVTIGSISPFTVNKVGGNFAVMTTRYRLSYVDVSRNIAVDGTDLGAGAASVFHEGSVIFTNGTRFTRTTWSWQNIYTQESIVGDNNTTLTTQLFGDYQLHRKIALLASAGYTDREAEFGPARFSGFIWDVGTRLTPGPRTNLTVRYGKTFFGNAWTVDGQYIITPNMNVTVSYRDNLATFQSFALQAFLAGGGNAADFPQDAVSQDFTRQKQWELNLVGTRGRSTLTLIGTILRSDSSIVLGDFKRYTVGAIWNRAMSPRLNVNIAAFLVDDKFVVDPQSDIFLSYSGGITYNISENLVGTIEYIYSDRKQQIFNFIPRKSNLVRVAIGATF